MFEHILALVLYGAASPWEAGDPASHTWTLQLDVSGQPSAACNGARLDVPVAEGGLIYFESKGVWYEGAEAANGMLVLLSDGERPLSLSGDPRAGGRWSRGGDGACAGSWRVAP
ncbi:hypothetical protein [Vineibacter terrae]|uniref:hypothetical protein n=1 Tax=Vineibacter terrae TaxID=2586908 RepID=UPI002E33109D|nr:hypothetical protein [Vineibacter terrae]HEX2891228.1 hypothetical protein [Vineibacter terrae]